MDNESQSIGLSIGFLAAQGSVATIAIKALIATHPNPAALRSVFDQMLGQLQASSGVVGGPAEIADAIRAAAAGLFVPPAHIDTGS